MPVPEAAPDLGKKVAVIGGGPSGMACAIELKKAGYGVTIFEAREKLGGMLYWGIPAYRLPKDVLDSETSIVERMGIEVRYDTQVGKDVSLKEIRKGFDAVYVGCGAAGGRKIGLPNEDAAGVMSGVEFLRLSNQQKPIDVRGKVVVVGGGNVAVDVALTARRMGKAEVHMICLEKWDEMPASKWEIEQSLEEGIKIHPSWGPCGIHLENGHVKAVEFRRCTAVFDDLGRFNPTFHEGVRKTYDADLVILAIGQSPETDFLKELPGFELLRGGWAKADALSLATGSPGVFAGGDLVTGPKMAIDAVSQGQEAAESIKRYLEGKDLKEGRCAKETELVVEVPEGIERRARAVIPSIPVDERRGFEEVELALDEATARAEAERCLNCRRCLGCKLCEEACKPGAIDYMLGPRRGADRRGQRHRRRRSRRVRCGAEAGARLRHVQECADEHRVRADPLGHGTHHEHGDASFRRESSEKGRLAPVRGKQGQDARILLLRLLHVRDQRGGHRKRASARHRADDLLHGRARLRQGVRPVLRESEARARRSLHKVLRVEDPGGPGDDRPRSGLCR